MSDLSLCYHFWSSPEIFCQPLSPIANGISLTQTLDFEMMRIVFYHCAVQQGFPALSIQQYFSVFVGEISIL
jgi:hypothetical protein